MKGEPSTAQEIPPAAAPAASTGETSSVIPPGGCRIRMYRQGLGDCWLLSFPSDAGLRHVLIDCGVHAAQTGGKQRIKAIAQDILKETGGHIHVLVATHEHSDHLSGFVEQRSVFKNIEIDELWLAWTEDRGDSVANRLRERRGHTLTAIRAALKKLNTAGEKAGAERIKRMAEFTPMEGAPLAAAADGAALSGDAATVSRQEMALELLTERARDVQYLRPGCPPIPIPGTSGVRAFVLGPPLAEDFLFQSDPSSGAAKEVYLSGPALNASSAFAVAAINASEDEKLDETGAELLNLSYPFDQRYRVSEKAARTHPALRSLLDEYYGSGDEWRRIDHAWLEAAGQLALHLEADTNNTSLALAFELGEGGQVMLFPGDAQVGSWRSWQKLKWKAAQGKTLGMDDLLARTTIYKVSHHASHNGTLKADGLEKMSDDLTALIPVDQAAASKLRGWNMPFAPLYERLIAKTGGRVLRSDKPCEMLDAKAKKPGSLTRAQWDRFRKASQRDLYFDVIVGD